MLVARAPTFVHDRRRLVLHVHFFVCVLHHIFLSSFSQKRQPIAPLVSPVSFSPSSSITDIHSIIRLIAFAHLVNVARSALCREKANESFLRLEPPDLPRTFLFSRQHEANDRLHRSLFFSRFIFTCFGV